uniref:Uncharacterized protein n=1 Tax=Rhizophora mucronata TaxID=61149 RepID=A0A2P2R177_RHIMU
MMVIVYHYMHHCLPYFCSYCVLCTRETRLLNLCLISSSCKVCVCANSLEEQL